LNNVTINVSSVLSRRGVGGLPSSRLIKSRGSVVPGDDSSMPDETVVDGNDESSEK